MELKDFFLSTDLDTRYPKISDDGSISVTSLNVSNTVYPGYVTTQQIKTSFADQTIYDSVEALSAAKYAELSGKPAPECGNLYKVRENDQIIPYTFDWLSKTFMRDEKGVVYRNQTTGSRTLIIGGYNKNTQYDVAIIGMANYNDTAPESIIAGIDLSAIKNSGSGNQGIALFGSKNLISGDNCGYSMVAGGSNTIKEKSNYSTITGKSNIISNDCPCSNAFGQNSHVINKNSFVWNSKTSKYESNGNGTFNVNPENGIKGFYIGKDNFATCVLSAISIMTAAEKQQLKTTLKELLGI